MEGDVRPLENRSCANREIQLAPITAIKSVFTLGQPLARCTSRADRAVRPQPRFQVGSRRGFIGKHLEKLKGADRRFAHNEGLSAGVTDPAPATTQAAPLTVDTARRSLHTSSIEPFCIGGFRFFRLSDAISTAIQQGEKFRVTSFFLPCLKVACAEVAKAAKHLTVLDFVDFPQREHFIDCVFCISMRLVASYVFEVLDSLTEVKRYFQLFSIVRELSM